MFAGQKAAHPAFDSHGRPRTAPITPSPSPKSGQVKAASVKSHSFASFKGPTSNQQATKTAGAPPSRVQAKQQAKDTNPSPPTRLQIRNEDPSAIAAQLEMLNRQNEGVKRRLAQSTDTRDM